MKHRTDPNVFDHQYVPFSVLPVILDDTDAPTETLNQT